MTFLCLSSFPFFRPESLHDRDTGVFDKDDHLGTVTASKAQAGKGEQQGKFTRDGANYTLYYEVV